MRKIISTVMIALIGAVCTGCTFDGINSIPLPGNSSGSDTVAVIVELTDAQNLVGNSPVKVDNVTVGNIRKIETKGWQARAYLDVDADKDIPGNVHASLAQTSLFGSQYIELALPDGTQPVGRLHDGATISANHTTEFPSVEEVLSSLSLVLNGAGLQQLRTITGELDRVVNGHEDSARSLVGRLNTFVSGLTAQRNDIARAITALADLSTELRTQKDVIANGITTIGPAVDILNQQERQLVTMLNSLGRFGDAATGVLNRSRDDLVGEVKALAPTLAQLSNSGNNLTEALKIALTVPFPVTTTSRGIRGDYLNLFLTLDISADKLAKVVIPSVLRQQRSAPSMARSHADPLRAPLAHRKAPRP